MKKTFNQELTGKVENILKVQYLGVNDFDVVEKTNENTDKIIVFNHDFEKTEILIILCPARGFWKTVRISKVWIPLLNKPNRDYVITDKFDKAGYYDKLYKCRVGFSPKQKYGGWSSHN